MPRGLTNTRRSSIANNVCAWTACNANVNEYISKKIAHWVNNGKAGWTINQRWVGRGIMSGMDCLVLEES